MKELDPKILRKKDFLSHALLFIDSMNTRDLKGFAKHQKSKSQAKLPKDGILDYEDDPTLNSWGDLFTSATLEQKTKTYRINETFLDALDSKANLELNISYMLKRFKIGEQICLEFPYNHRFQPGHVYHKTVILTMVMGNENQPFLFVTMPGYCSTTDKLEVEDDPTRVSFSWSISPMISDKELEYSFQHHPTEEYEFMKKVLKVLLYIRSDGQPDLRDILWHKITTKKPKKALSQFIENELFPTINVGFGFAKSPMYTKEKWDYLRWQPYGPRDNPMYKLIHVTARRRK